MAEFLSTADRRPDHSAVHKVRTCSLLTDHAGRYGDGLRALGIRGIIRRTEDSPQCALTLEHPSITTANIRFVTSREIPNPESALFQQAGGIVSALAHATI